MQVDGALAAQALMGLFQGHVPLAPHPVPQPSLLGAPKRIPCGDNTFAQCPEYYEGCFEYSPMFCPDAQRRPMAQQPAAPPSPVQPAAQLWRESPTPNLNSDLPLDVQFCIRNACDALEPTQASLCYCQGTANDPRLCDPPLGLALPMAVAAHAVCAIPR